jgi:acyl-CoA thioesterase-2
MPIISLEDIVRSLELETLGPDRFTAPNVPMDYRRIFGGQLLAQAIAVATHSARGKRVKSIHVTVPREGDLGEPVEFRVEAIQDGRSFATRWIVGSQGDQRVVTALVSLHADEAGLSHHCAPPEVGEPESATPTDLDMIPWETRIVDAVDLAEPSAGPARFDFWMRAPALPDDPMVHQALLAHATDLTLIGTALRPHAGLSQADSPERLATAVTTHTVWFHRPFRIDDWLLVAQESPSTHGARGFGQGHVFSGSPLSDAVPVASFAQESLIRER